MILEVNFTGIRVHWYKAKAISTILPSVSIIMLPQIDIQTLIIVITQLGVALLTHN